MDSKNSKIVGIILIITIAIVFIGLGVLGYTVLRKDSKKGTDNQLSEQKTVNKELGGSSSKSEGGNSQLQTIETNSKTTEKKYLEDYEIIGKIEIPKTGLKSDILAETTKRSLEIAVTKIYSTSDLNQPGNTVIYGHNYRNSSFFSKNGNLEIGDTLYITDKEGNKLTYEIYDKFETSSTDTSFYPRSAEDTVGKCEVTLSTCTDDASQTDRRLILLAKEM
jgi:LPXTG-site transpeptidase (sortase) family protein